MAWVAVPALTVQPDRQRYRHQATNGQHEIIRYEAICDSFSADIAVDCDGVVIDYPGIARFVIGGFPSRV